VNSVTTYWNGGTSQWVPEAETWNNTTGLGSWTKDTDLPTWESGVTYTAESKAVDNAGNEQVSLGTSAFTYDAQSPQITNLTKTEAITSVVFEWDTSEASDSAVEHWIGTGSSDTASDSRMLTDHSITISNLTPDTTYNYKVKSTDSIGNTSESTGTFATRSTSDVAVTEQPATSSILVQWATPNNPSSSYVEYSLTVSNFDDPNRVGVKVAGQDESAESHSVTVYDLQPLQTYYFRIKSEDTKGNTITSTDLTSSPSGTFKTFFIDKAAPVVSETNVSTGVSGATVTWNTNENSDSVVEYKKETETEYRVLSGDPKLVTNSHSVNLRSLVASTKYNFRIKSKDAANNVVTTDAGTFTTQSLGISTPSVSVTATSATVNWTTNVASSSQVEYQKQNANTASKIEGNPDMTTNHSVTIKGLSSGRYTYKVKSIDNDSNIAESSLLTFEIPTADSGSLGIPKAGKVEEQNITATSAKITWESAISTTSWVDYGTQPGVYTNAAGDDNMTKSHVVTLTNLVSDTTYYYRIRGVDSNGVEYISQEYSFKALAEPAISGIQVKDVGPYTATIVWSTNIRTDSGVNYGLAIPYDKREQSADMTTTHSVTLKNLTDSATYHFQAEVKDEFGHTIKSEDKTFQTPLDTQGPRISEVKLSPMTGSDESKRGVIITWVTDKEATAQVEYGSGVTPGKYDNKSQIDPGYNFSHTTIINDLEPGTTYHFRLVSKDKRGNEGKSQDYTMLTQEKEESIFQLILKTLEETFSWVGRVKDFLAQQFGKLIGK